MAESSGQYGECMTDVMTDAITEEALFELLSLECRVDSDGSVRYYNALGQVHRVYGPAFEHPDGSRAWYQNGQRHRLDGPAIEYSGGYQAWYQTGQRHRIDGPAIEYADGEHEWHINGKELTEAELQQAVASMGNACLPQRRPQY